MDIALLVGYTASVCSVTSFVSQVCKVLKSGDTAAYPRECMLSPPLLCTLERLRHAQKRVAESAFACLALS